MSSTHFALHYHLVFGTKDQEATIGRGWRDRLHAYLGGCVGAIEGVPTAIGGVADHVHLLVSLRPTHQLSEVLRDIKSKSSGWVHADIGDRSFGWQDGYGAFTVSPFATRDRPGLHRATGRPPPDAHLLRGIRRVPAQTRDPFRRQIPLVSPRFRHPCRGAGRVWRHNPGVLTPATFQQPSRAGGLGFHGALHGVESLAAIRRKSRGGQRANCIVPA